LGRPVPAIVEVDYNFWFWGESAVFDTCGGRM